MKIIAETITHESFKHLGAIQEISKADAECYHAGWGFYPDFLQLDMGGKPVSCSLNKVSGRLEEITKVEYHQHTCEGILPLDNDIYLFAGPSHWEMKLDEIRLFRVHKGTMVRLNPGVLHGAPISADGRETNVLIFLPQRTYANDCVFTELKSTDYIRLEY